MDWLLVTPQIQSTFSSLGSFESGTYVVSPNALAILEEIIYKLTYEDQTLRTFRRAIGFSQNVRTDLIPLLENAHDKAILDAVIRILVNITVPVECLFSVDVIYRTEVGRHTIFELNKLLYTSKDAFTDPKSTQSVIEYMKHILESDSKLSPEKCDQINNCLLLLRNILHIPENNGNFIVPASPTIGGSHTVSMQNTILWNLFIQSIDKLLLYLMSCPQRAFWGVTMVQLIALIYKDQHVSTLQKLLNLWFEASLSESSEDNESNTSPQKQGSGTSSPMLTSDPTSDSSDNGIRICKKQCTSEERRQVLRNETEAILQEVSRKGQAYYDSMLLAEDSDSTSKMQTTDTDEPTTPEAYVTSAKTDAVEAMESVESEDNQPAQKSVVKLDSEEEANNLQPAKHNVNTTKPKSQFNPPIAKPNKANHAAETTVNKNSSEVSEDEPPKASTKSPHVGQLNFSKGKSGPQKRECQSSQSEQSDCGYGTQAENQESISTSSNDDDGPQGKPQHQKPPCNTKPRNKDRVVLTIVDNKELRRKKLVKRSKSNLINMKGLVLHTPTDEDISNLLKEFTVDFLLKGYGFLVEELHSQLTLAHMKVPIDTSHFFWLLTYFLKFAAQLELDMEHINAILNYDVISYLTYEGVVLCEQLELSMLQDGNDPKPCLRRIHLVVTAIREFLQSIETYKKVTHLTQEDQQRLHQLQLKITNTEDLRLLFILLIRRFNPNLYTKQYLQDLVVTNHILLLIVDSVSKTDDTVNIDMFEHLSQFATVEVMNNYGMLLEDFNSNGEFVNDCIFTMMHHISGDLGHIGTLFQPVILKTFSRIWETKYKLCDDWTDLIEYVIHSFMKTPQKSKLVSPNSTLTELIKEYNSENTMCTWTQEEMDTLYWYYVQSKKCPDIAGNIANLFSSNGKKYKSRLSIIHQLLQQDIISLVKYNDLMKIEDGECQRNGLAATARTDSGIDMKDSVASNEKPVDDVQMLIDLITKENKAQYIKWLQKLLLECCYIKQNIGNAQKRNNLKYIMEPVAYYSILKNHAVPMVQWSPEQALTINYEPFVLLMHKLGFLLPIVSGTLFVRIPAEWSATTMYSVAKTLAPLDQLFIKFDVKPLDEELAQAAMNNCQQTEATSGPAHSDSHAPSLEKPLKTEPVEPDDNKSNANSIFAVPKVKNCNSAIRFATETVAPPTMPNWLQLVLRSNEGTAGADNHENSDSASVASDLTRMYVSDEDEKHEYRISHYH